MEAFASDLRRGYASEINEFLKLFVYASKDIGSAKGK